VLPVLVDGWQDGPWAREAVARAWADMGPAAASAGPLLAAELAEVRRLDNRRPGHYPQMLEKDLEPIDAARAAVRAVA
jgi:hypothetical protein